MSITEQPLPQHPGPPWPLHTVATRSLDNIVADIRSANEHAVQTVAAVRADADEKIHALEVTVTRLAAERDRERLRADGLQAAAEALVADHLRRQEQLQAELCSAGTENAGQHRVNLALQDRLDDAVRQQRLLRDKNALLVAENQTLRIENTALRTDLTQAGGRHRFRRR